MKTETYLEMKKRLERRERMLIIIALILPFVPLTLIYFLHI